MIFKKNKTAIHRRSNREEPTLSPKAAALVREAGWLLVVALLAFLTLILATYHRADPGWSYSGAAGSTAIQNKGGVVGAWLADLLFFFFGVSCWWWVFAGVILVVGGFRRIAAHDHGQSEARHHPWLAIP